MERPRKLDVDSQQIRPFKDAAMLDETNKLTVAVALVRAALLSERWADAELALLDAERQIAILHRFVAEKHTAALQLRKKNKDDQG